MFKGDQPEFTQGKYRVAAVDYWGRMGAYSDSVLYVSHSWTFMSNNDMLDSCHSARQYVLEPETIKRKKKQICLVQCQYFRNAFYPVLNLNLTSIFKMLYTGVYDT